MQVGKICDRPQRETQVSTPLLPLLKQRYNARACHKREKASCAKCKGQHHLSICSDAGTTTRTIGTTPTTAGKIDVAPSNFTYLQTGRVRVVAPSGLSKLTRCVLDSGRQTSFVSKSIRDALKLDVIERRNLAVSAFELSSVT
jgi:hypothetical protein